MIKYLWRNAGMKALFLLLLFVSNVFAAEEMYVGWVSDSGCALARASAGKYTATNPDCARRCVKAGKHIVIISPDVKSVIAIENPEVLKSQVGNKVRVSGRFTRAHLLHVNNVVFIEESHPECERPPLKK
jgi:hypothetical protein